jgi:TRAP-type C4-dicarboxylate transport system permease small subunit
METNSHIAPRVDGFFMAVMKYFKHIAAILLVLMPIPVFLDVVIRLVVDYSLPGIIELEEFLLLIIIFFQSHMFTAGVDISAST